VDYRISSLESDVCRIRSDVDSVRYDLTRLSDRIHDLELERERKKQGWETFFQVLLIFLGTVLIVSSIVTGKPEPPEVHSP
jgi:hypothetical protein